MAILKEHWRDEMLREDAERHGYQRGPCMYCGSPVYTDTGVWVCYKSECMRKWKDGEEPDE